MLFIVTDDCNCFNGLVKIVFYRKEVHVHADALQMYLNLPVDSKMFVLL